MTLKKLNARGISHILVPMLIIVGIALYGTYILVKSHADVNTYSASATPSCGSDTYGSPVAGQCNNNVPGTAKAPTTYPGKNPTCANGSPATNVSGQGYKCPPNNTGAVTFHCDPGDTGPDGAHYCSHPTGYTCPADHGVTPSQPSTCTHSYAATMNYSCKPGDGNPDPTTHKCTSASSTAASTSPSTSPTNSGTTTHASTSGPAGTLSCAGNTATSNILSISYSGAGSTGAALYRYGAPGNSAIATYSGASGSGAHEDKGIKTDTAYAYQLRSGSTVLANVTCTTATAASTSPSTSPTNSGTTTHASTSGPAGTLSCAGNTATSNILSISYSGAGSTGAALYRYGAPGNSAIATYSGASGSGAHEDKGIKTDTAYAYQLRSGSTVLANVTCTTPPTTNTTTIASTTKPTTSKTSATCTIANVYPLPAYNVVIDPKLTITNTGTTTINPTLTITTPATGVATTQIGSIAPGKSISTGMQAYTVGYASNNVRQVGYSVTSNNPDLGCGQTALLPVKPGVKEPTPATGSISCSNPTTDSIRIDVAFSGVDSAILSQPPTTLKTFVARGGWYQNVNLKPGTSYTYTLTSGETELTKSVTCVTAQTSGQKTAAKTTVANNSSSATQLIPASSANPLVTIPTGCPGSNQAGTPSVDCNKIPLGCPGSTQQGLVAKTPSACPYSKPSIISHILSAPVRVIEQLRARLGL